VIPAAPGYVGTYDAAVLLALRSLGKPALGYLLVLRFVLFVPITIAGFAVFLSRTEFFKKTVDKAVRRQE
jgi:uncharacterized membrane protein YbhN (UPF0104 family)